MISCVHILLTVHCISMFDVLKRVERPSHPVLKPAGLHGVMVMEVLLPQNKQLIMLLPQHVDTTGEVGSTSS